MVGGFQSFYNLLPFLVQIIIKPYGQAPSYICGGSLITYDVVLTAAHCLVRNNSVYYVGVGGTTNSFTVKDNGRVEFLSGQTRRVGAIYKHEYYDSVMTGNDIALIKVYVPFDPQTSLAPLPQKDEKIDLADKYKYCFLGGFGLIGENNILAFDKNRKEWTFFRDRKYSEQVVYLTLPLISNAQCRSIWNSDTKISFRDVNSSQICTLYYPGRKSYCFGDSGAPLLCGSSQYGIVSNGYSCGHARIGANVYTRVDKYLNWINESLNNVKIVMTEKEFEEFANISGHNPANRLSSFTVLIFLFVLIYILRHMYNFQ